MTVCGYKRKWKHRPGVMDLSSIEYKGNKEGESGRKGIKEREVYFQVGPVALASFFNQL